VRFSVAPGVSADTFPRLATRTNQSRRIVVLAAFKWPEDYQRPGVKVEGGTSPVFLLSGFGG
jgi:hypothetical protein